MIRIKKLKIFAAAAVLLMTVCTASACVGERNRMQPSELAALTEEDDATVGTVLDDRTAVGVYGYTEASEAPDGESPLYGIMHADIIEISRSSGDSGTVYCMTDKADPDNIWSLTSPEIGYIGVELAEGDRVTVFFSGDIINDSENTQFLAIVPDDEYTIRKLTGYTTANMMNSFTVTAQGTEHVFVKDNCRMDDRALMTDLGEEVTVYYAEGSDANYPLRVFSGR